MAAQLFGSHVAHASNGLSRVRINGFCRLVDRNFASPKSTTVGNSPMMACEGP